MRLLLFCMFLLPAALSFTATPTPDCPTCTRCKGSGEIIFRCRPIFPDCEPGPYPCPNCDGSGKICPKPVVQPPVRVDPPPPRPVCVCKTCKGRGGRAWGRGAEAEWVECNACGGDGKCH